MLSRLIALPLQIVVAWLAAPYLVAFLPVNGVWGLLTYAVVFAVLVWLVGVMIAETMQADLPPAGTLIAAVSLATVGAALSIWLPAFVPETASALRRIPDQVYPLVGAVLGYQIRWSSLQASPQSI